MEDFVIRKYQTGDEHLINKGFNKIFGLRRSIQEWYWKFKDPNDSRIMLSLDAEEVLSHYAVQTDRFQYLGELLTAGHSVDTFSVRKAKATSGRSLQKLVQQFFDEFGSAEDVALMYGFPGERILRLGHIKLDYGRACPVKYWELELPAKPKKLPGAANHPGPPAKINQLWNRASWRYPVSIVRDYKWLHKRFLSRPNHKYQFIRRTRWGRYSLLCTFVRDRNMIEVVDIVWDGSSRRDIKFVTEALSSTAHRYGIPRVSLWLSGDKKLEELLEKYGWKMREEPHKLHLVVKSFVSTIDREELLDRFYLTKGCTDII